MSKIDIEEVEQVLLQRQVPETTAIINDLQKILEELAAEKEKEKEDKPKFEYVVVINDPNGLLNRPQAENELTAYVVQQEENEDAGLILSKLEDATKEHNLASKKKKQRLYNLKDIFGGLKPKYLKERKVKIKTKEPVRVLIAKELKNLSPLETDDQSEPQNEVPEPYSYSSDNEESTEEQTA
jgi:hypothetical protein